MHNFIPFSIFIIIIILIYLSLIDRQGLLFLKENVKVKWLHVLLTDDMAERYHYVCPWIKMLFYLFREVCLVSLHSHHYACIYPLGSIASCSWFRFNRHYFGKEWSRSLISTQRYSMLLQALFPKHVSSLFSLPHFLRWWSCTDYSWAIKSQWKK